MEGGGAPGGGQLAVTVKARRQFEFSEGGQSAWKDEEGGYTVARVVWSADDEEAVVLLDDDDGEPSVRNSRTPAACTPASPGHLMKSSLRRHDVTCVCSTSTLLVLRRNRSPASSRLMPCCGQGEDGASELPSLVSEWEQLVRQGGHERSKDHLDKVLDELGPMPDPGSEPGKLSMWVGVSRTLPSIVAARSSFSSRAL